MTEPELIDRAIELQRLGRLDAAAAVYARILESDPDHLDALHLLGVVAYQQGDDERALALIGRAIALDGGQAKAHNHLGLALMRLGRWEEAAESFGRALAVDPASAQAHNNLGTLRRRQGRLGEAAASCERALAIDPEYANAHFNLGEVRRAGGDLDGAAASFRQGTALDPASADGLAGLAEILLALGQPAAAVPAYEQALARAPGHAAWHCGLGDALHALGELTAATAAYHQALARDEACGPAWWGMGCAEATRGEHVAAAASFQRAVAIEPGHGQAHHNLGKALFELGLIDPALDALRQAAAVLDDPEQPLGTIATIIAGSPRADNQAVLDARRRWAAVGARESSRRMSPHRPIDAAGRRLKVGYLSAFFQHRNWMKPVWALVNHHDRDRFEVHLFSDALRSLVEHGYRGHPQDRFHDLCGVANDDAARLIEAQGIDVLVDLNGYSQLARLPLVASRPAPVVVAWFNLFAPSGLSGLDCVIGDRHVLPAGEKRFYTERVVRVPGCYLTFEVTYPVPDVAPAPCLTRRALTFGCLCPQYKMTPPVIEAWARILAACPATRLLLKNTILGSEENRRFVRHLFAQLGIAGDRLDLEGPAEHFAFLARYAEVDVALDPFPYNGGTTTMEALWQGVPVITFAGDRWASRIGASLMRNARLPEFVAKDLDGYVATAVDLARGSDTPARLDALRRGLRDRLRQAPVCDARAFARNMERVYLRLRRWRGSRSRGL